MPSVASKLIVPSVIMLNVFTPSVVAQSCNLVLKCKIRIIVVTCNSVKRFYSLGPWLCFCS
jgi:hypothetical protein